MLFFKKHWMRVWQAAFLLVSTTWLFAPYLNDLLSERTTYISQYIIPSMPYAWIFRTGEFIAGLLLFFIAARAYKKYRRLTVPVGMLALIGVIIFVDLMIPPTCQIVNGVCERYGFIQNFLHDLESIGGFLVIFGLGVWDAWKSKRLPSKIFIGLQVILGGLLALGIADDYKFTTVVQFSYQLLAVVWIAWYVASLFDKETYDIKQNFINKIIGIWVGLQGALAIIIAVAHIDLYTKVQGAYFGTYDVLIGSHSMIVGVTLLYLSRQLIRGERRAWQLLLVLLGLEVIKYATIAANPIFIFVTMLTFVGIFVSRDFFNRGMIHRTWKIRTQDTAVVVIGACTAIIFVGYFLLGSPFSSSLSDNFRETHKTVQATSASSESSVKNSIRSQVSAAAVAAICWFILWSLFRPAKSVSVFASKQEIEEAESLLQFNSTSTEDFFKLWPEDKDYFWSKKRDGFIAYKVVGPIAFALADPVTEKKTAKKRLLKEFVDYCKAHGWRACFLLISEESAAMYEKTGLRKMQIGASAVIDINEYATDTSTNKWWRWQRNKGRKMNYQYEVLEPPHADTIMKRLREISDEWLTRGGHQEESFAMGYFDANYLQKCRIHILRNEAGEIIAFVNQMPTFNNLPQTTIDLIRFVNEEPNANNFLLYSMLHRLDEEGKYKRFDLGFVPLAQMQGKLANIARRLGANRYSAGGLEQFKGKFEPDWKPNYIAYDGDVADLALVALHLEKAMTVNANKDDE